jgi:hypothetical protein
MEKKSVNCKVKRDRDREVWNSHTIPIRLTVQPPPSRSQQQTTSIAIMSEIHTNITNSSDVQVPASPFIPASLASSTSSAPVGDTTMSASAVTNVPSSVVAAAATVVTAPAAPTANTNATAPVPSTSSSVAPTAPNASAASSTSSSSSSASSSASSAAGQTVVVETNKTSEDKPPITVVKTQNFTDMKDEDIEHHLSVEKAWMPGKQSGFRYRNVMWRKNRPYFNMMGVVCLDPDFDRNKGKYAKKGQNQPVKANFNVSPQTLNNFHKLDDLFATTLDNNQTLKSNYTTMVKKGATRDPKLREMDPSMIPKDTPRYQDHIAMDIPHSKKDENVFELPCFTKVDGKWKSADIRTVLRYGNLVEFTFEMSLWHLKSTNKWGVKLVLKRCNLIKLKSVQTDFEMSSSTTEIEALGAGDYVGVDSSNKNPDSGVSSSSSSSGGGSVDNGKNGDMQGVSSKKRKSSDDDGESAERKSINI